MIFFHSKEFQSDFESDCVLPYSFFVYKGYVGIIFKHLNFGRPILVEIPEPSERPSECEADLGHHQREDGRCKLLCLLRIRPSRRRLEDWQMLVVSGTWVNMVAEKTYLRT